MGEKRLLFRKDSVEKNMSYLYLYGRIMLYCGKCQKTTLNPPAETYDLDQEPRILSSSPDNAYQIIETRPGMSEMTVYTCEHCNNVISTHDKDLNIMHYGGPDHNDFFSHMLVYEIGNKIVVLYAHKFIHTFEKAIVPRVVGHTLSIDTTTGRTYSIKRSYNNKGGSFVRDVSQGYGEELGFLNKHTTDEERQIIYNLVEDKIKAQCGEDVCSLHSMYFAEMLENPGMLNCDWYYHYSFRDIVLFNRMPFIDLRKYKHIQIDVSRVYRRNPRAFLDVPRNKDAEDILINNFVREDISEQARNAIKEDMTNLLYYSFMSKIFSEKHWFGPMSMIKDHFINLYGPIKDINAKARMLRYVLKYQDEDEVIQFLCCTKQRYDVYETLLFANMCYRQLRKEKALHKVPKDNLIQRLYKGGKILGCKR